MLAITRRCLAFRRAQALRAHSTRVISTSSFRPCLRDFALSLARKQPCFAVAPERVRVLTQPHDFYTTLLDMIRGAQRRIFLSSLYIGSSEHELITTLHDALIRNPFLQLYLQLDLNRSTRPGASSTTTLLQPLLQNFPDRVHVSLFRSPKLKGLMARLVPPRFNEGWGTWHAKIYGADDNVMISGANLNKSYFTDRQDRYLHFSAEPAMANYCLAFLETASGFSYRLLPPSGNGPSTPTWTNPTMHPHSIEPHAGKAFATLQSVSRRVARAKTESEVLVFPIIQAGQFGIREEEECLNSLFDHLAATKSDTRPCLNLTSGYFGLYKPYQDRILSTSVDTRIICASPKANGFYGSRGLSGRIPEGYTLLEQRFMRAVGREGKSCLPSARHHEEGSNVELSEWQKDGWTYHAKGIWVSPTPTTPPELTVFGSTNLNSRSAHLDTELSFILLTSAASLRQKLHEELQGLRAHAIPWRGAERRVRLGTKALVGMVGGML
ncbi:CDP-diacylglycerol-glycerol-3-phosphate 3-phosphatidyltransferase [Amylostereum chailletii]|nr:CDP-diacylglycerol-glycerol-3-phosphate 3-phosphatidyltransferase [Amylostereum chailletii]